MCIPVLVSLGCALLLRVGWCNLLCKSAPFHLVKGNSPERRAAVTLAATLTAAGDGFTEPQWTLIKEAINSSHYC